MDRTTAKDLVAEALDKLYYHDSFLLEHDVHERTIVHKFADYLQTELDRLGLDNDIVVDCEYNREGHGDIKLLPEPDEDNEEDAIYPDVIVHSRGNHDKNLLVIEVKKGSNTQNVDSDKLRLEILTNDGYDERYNYNQGLFLMFPVGEEWEDEAETTWHPKSDEGPSERT
ncbi:hypothetical protein [Haladaptatus sp. NG-SE-30]